MPLEIDVCGNGVARTNFYMLRAEVAAAGGTFDPGALLHVPYEQLGLCATAAAGPQACSVDDAAREMWRRRQRFLSIPSRELDECKRYLQVEGMYEDVLRDIQHVCSPKWETLSCRQRAWYKLTCLYNHVDRPIDRLLESVQLLRACEVRGELPEGAGKAFRQEAERIRYEAAYGARDAALRLWIGRLADNVLEFLSEDQQTMCAKELVRDYQCTSDCFRGLRSTDV